MDEQQEQLHSRRSYIYESKGGKSKKKLFAIIGGIIIVLLVIVIGSMAFSGNEDPEEEDIFATPATQAPTDTPTPTPTDTNNETTKEDPDPTTGEKADTDLDRSEYTILIQNGSGTAGAAGRLADILGDLGYTSGGTENADNFDYLETEIHVSSGNKALLDLLKSDLEDEYTIGETSTDYDGDDDAVVIIGAE